MSAHCHLPTEFGVTGGWAVKGAERNGGRKGECVMTDEGE